jgi:hypothetical protein
MANIVFTIEHDSFAFGPFPVDELNELDGLNVTSKIVTSLKEEVTFTFHDDDDVHAAIFVIGQYAYKLMHINRIEKQN